MRTVDPEKYEAKRRLILDAAIVCFAECGFHEASTAEICVKAGMSPGNLFHYFKNKNAIIEAIVDENRREMVERYVKASHAADPFEGLCDVLEENLARVAKPVYCKLGSEILAEAMRNPVIRQLAARREMEAMAVLTGFLKTAAARGQIDASLDTAKLATWIFALGDGTFGRAAFDPSFNPIDQGPMLREVLTRILKPASTRGSRPDRMGGWEKTGPDLD